MRKRWSWRSAFPPGEGVLLRRRHLHRQPPRAEASRANWATLGMTWSCNAKANVPYETLKIMRDNGLRLLLVGYRERQPADPA